jgi:hypothetical protein
LQGVVGLELGRCDPPVVARNQILVDVRRLVHDLLVALAVTASLCECQDSSVSE